MLLKVYSILDLKTSSFSNPVYFKTRGEALRSLTDLVNSGNKDSLMCIHPSDFSLYELGDFLQNSGDFDLLDAPLPVCILSELVAS